MKNRMGRQAGISSSSVVNASKRAECENSRRSAKATVRKDKSRIFIAGVATRNICFSRLGISKVIAPHPCFLKVSYPVTKKRLNTGKGEILPCVGYDHLPLRVTLLVVTRYT